MSNADERIEELAEVAYEWLVRGDGEPSARDLQDVLEMEGPDVALDEHAGDAAEDIEAHWPEVQRELGARVFAEVCQLAGMSQYELARRWGSSRSQIAMMQTGDREIRVRDALALRQTIADQNEGASRS